MQKWWRLTRYYGIGVSLLLFVLLTAALLVYLAGTLGTQPGTRTLIVPVVSAPPPLPGTPVALFAPLDPALLPLLRGAQPDYGALPLAALGQEVQPVGAYLPRSGNTQTGLPSATLPPTPLPYATERPLPLPTVATQVLPTVLPLPSLDPTRVAAGYGGDDCAPSGNPVEGILTQRFHGYHPGIDIAVPLNTPVRATHSGTVTFAEWSNVGYGYLVIIQNGVFITYYAHNTSFNVRQGEIVGKGAILAYSGSTGNSTGPHVHYEIRINDVPVDPLSFDNRGYRSC